MSAKIGSLIIDLSANVAKLQQDFARAEGVVAGAIKKMGSIAAGFGAAAAGYFAVNKITNWLDHALKAADGVATLSTRTGVSAESLSALGYAASISDASLEAVAKSLGMLNQKMLDAHNGKKEVADAFKQIGVSAVDANGNLRASDEVLMDIADRFAKMPDGPAKSALAMKMMGEQGVRLIPMLNAGRAGIEAMKKEAADLGQVIGNDTARQAEALQANLSKLNNGLAGVANQVVAALLPGLLQLTDKLLGNAKGAQEFADVFVAGFKLVASAGVIVVAVIETLAKNIAATVSAAVSVLQGDFAGAWQTLKDRGAEMVDDLSGRLDDLSAIWTETSDAAARAGAATGSTLEGVVIPSIKKASDEAQRLADRIADTYLRIESNAAALTKTRTDDIRASYAAQYAALQRKIDDEKTGEAEAQAYLLELHSLRRKEVAELAEAEAEERKAAERSVVDQVLQTNAAIARATKTQTDDLLAQLEIQKEAIRRRVEDELLDKALADEQIRAAEADTQRQISEIHQREADKRAQESARSAQAAASYFGSAIGNLVLAPLQKGFKGLETILDMVSGIITDLLKRIIANAAAFALLAMVSGGSAPAFGFAKLLGFSEGGYFRGYGTKTSDSNIVAVSDGEFIVRAAAVDHFGPGFFDALNNMRLPAFARGGLVGGAPMPGQGGTTVYAPTIQVRTLTPADSVAVVAETVGPAQRQRVSNRQGAADMHALARGIQRPRSGA